MTVPHDDDAEINLIGSMLLSRDAARNGMKIVDASDFYSPPRAAAFDAIAARVRTGEPIDPILVASDLDNDPVARHRAPADGWKRFLLAVQAETYASVNGAEYAHVVADASDRRRIMRLGADLVERAQDVDASNDDIVDYAAAALGAATRPSAARRLPPFGEWRHTVDTTPAWVVPNVIERRDRAIIVAPEGTGKSFILRLWALMAACGVHWFTERPITPVTTLVVDVENSARQIVRNTDVMYRVACRTRPDWDESRYVIAPFDHLDLGQRADRQRVESFIEGHRPDLLVIGPLYKIFPPDSRRSYEDNALIATAIIDRWRSEYDVAVLMEGHAPKGSQGHRDLDPRGSAVLLGWPEFGITLAPDETNPRALRVGRFRGDREAREWPDRIVRDVYPNWPWRATAEHRVNAIATEDF